MLNQRIGSFIALLRKKQSMTQAQLAERPGVSNRSISRWENGGLMLYSDDVPIEIDGRNLDLITTKLQKLIMD